ncbi:hypothetical protein QTO01_02460 [Vibrio mytili]|uniref:hypothetical protein n=1 Tax=Vibrio mytili TaxID=50718 RepID=UPI002F40273A
MTDYTVNIKACIFELQESREYLSDTFTQLYQFHQQKSQIEGGQNNNQLWQCFFEFCESLKQVKKYYDQAVTLLQQDPVMQPICKQAVDFLERHYGRNSVHKVVYHSQDRNSVIQALQKLIADIESGDVRQVCAKRSILYTFFDLAEDSVDDFAGKTEQHYFQSLNSEYAPRYFYDEWQQKRRSQLFRCAVQDEALIALVLKYVKLIDEYNMNLGSESDLRYYSDQVQLFDALYIALLEISDKYIIDYIDSYSLTYRWYNHLPEIKLVNHLLERYPDSPYLKYLYPATAHRMSGNSNDCPPFSKWYLSQLSDPDFIEEQLLICASDIIRAEQVCYSSASFSTLTDIQHDDDFMHLLHGCIKECTEQEELLEEISQDDLYIYCNNDFYDRLALALIGEELSVENAAEFLTKRRELKVRVANNLRGILEGIIEPAFEVCYGYSSFCELRDQAQRVRVTPPLFSLHNVNSFAYVNYLGVSYLISQSDDDVTITQSETMTPVSFRPIPDDGLYAVAYALRPKEDSPVHFATLDWKQGLLQGWHLGQSLPVITFRLNAFQSHLPFELSADGRTLLIGITQELDEDANLNADLFDVKVEGKDAVVAIDLASGRERCRFEHIPGQTLKLSPTGNFALYSQVIDLDSTDRLISVDLTTGAEKTVQLPYRFGIGSDEFAISFDGQRLVYKQSVVDLRTGECLVRLSNDDFVYAYEFSQCDEYVIATISEDNVRDIYRVSTGEHLVRIYGSDGPLLTQNYLDAEKGIFYSFDDYSISMHDVGSELGLDREPLGEPEYQSGRVRDTVIGPKVNRRKGSFSNDEYGTLLEIQQFGVQGEKGILVPPQWYHQDESLPVVGVDFILRVKGIRTVQGFVVKLKHPDIDGKTQTEWQAIGKHGQTLMLRDPFTALQRREGLYEFEVYSLDQRLLLARQMIHIGFAQVQPCQINVAAFGGFFGTHHPADKKAVINYDDTTIGYHLVVRCPDVKLNQCVKSSQGVKSRTDIKPSIKLKSRIYREHGAENVEKDRLFKSFSVQREINVVDGQTVELVIQGKESNGYINGIWRFELLDAFSDEVLFSETLTIYEQDHHHTEDKVLVLDLVEYGIYDPGDSYDYRQRRVVDTAQAVLVKQTNNLPQQTELMYGYKFKVNDACPDAVYRVCIEQWASGQQWIGADDGNDRYKTHWTTIQKGELNMASWTIAAEHEIFSDMSRVLVRHGSSALIMMHDFHAQKEAVA